VTGPVSTVRPKDAFSQVEDVGERRRVAGVPSSLLVRFATLAAIWAYSVSQPVFSFLRGNPEFLVLRDATRTDTIAFAILLAFGPPLAAVAYTSLAGLVSRWVGDVLYLAAFTVFLVPFAFQLTKAIEPSVRTSLLVVVAFSALALAIYVRWRAVRLFVAFSVVLPVAALAWFVLGIPTTIDEAEAAQVTMESRPPVVLVVFDELPISSLMSRDGRIDGVRYPGFGGLVRDATWYPNTTSVHTFTSKAVPAILTGVRPREESLPTLKDHPDNLFTLLGGGYSFFVHEATTRLCPENLCPRVRDSHLESVNVLFQDVRAPYVLKVLPDSVTGAGDGAIPADGTFGRASDAAAESFERFIEGFSRNQPTASLYYDHVLLPHFPWRFLPSGRMFDVPSGDHPAGRTRWGEDPWLMEQHLQRHLVQLRYTDALLGKLIRKLKRAGIYERALVVVTSDHGASFRPGYTLRDVSVDNVAAVARVPLFVKYPGQEHGGLDRRPARTTDVLPTVADVLGIRVPWDFDGTSLVGEAPQRTHAEVLDDKGVWVRASLGTVERQNEALVRRNTTWFGQGRDSLFDIGIHKELLGNRVETSWPESQTVRISIEDGSRLENVQPASGFVPAKITGRVTEGDIPHGTELAVAVNGRIRALTRCVVEGGRQQFGALVPESAFREGANDVDVYLVVGNGKGESSSLIRVGRG
jgi:sulfatase-like protein